MLQLCIAEGKRTTENVEGAISQTHKTGGFWVPFLGIKLISGQSHELLNILTSLVC